MDKDSLLNLIDSPLAEVLVRIISEADSRSYKWYSTKQSRGAISNKTGQSPPTVSRNIAKLVDKGILTKGDARGLYIINHHYITL